MTDRTVNGNLKNYHPTAEKRLPSPYRKFLALASPKASFTSNQ